MRARSPSSALGPRLRACATPRAARVLWKNYRLLLPEDTYRTRWNRLLLVLVLYNTACLPLDLCFGARLPRPLDYSVDGFFLIDILLNLRTTYINADSAEINVDWRLAGAPRPPAPGVPCARRPQRARSPRAR